ncbi:hypothetical protein FLL45_13570 [Aliikangiella marina]|uniref:Sel1 repeat family protein n=1 Tax=Aliikangiella marina TaxID=1712262 RepID=A0A545T9K7_9GAMM|nr:hypothetical protein [Aliikangiella marina]TQV73888.1 hypothetical protein FLL45_13570 [Aliikangiella marina]
MKLGIVCLLALFVSVSQAEASNEESSEPKCESSGEFVSYKAGVYAEKSNKKAHAFNLYCNVAYKGDYRAQFKLARLYLHGIDGYLSSNKVVAGVWARISNSVARSVKRKNLINQIESELSKDELAELNSIYTTARALIPSGNRIDHQYIKEDLSKYLKDEKRVYTGSRIKRKKDNAPNNLDTFDFN